jgi:hypothetical protein
MLLDCASGYDRFLEFFSAGIWFISVNPKIFLRGSIKVNEEYFLYYRNSSLSVFRYRLISQHILLPPYSY